MMRTTFATGAISVPGNFQAERISAEMSHLAKKFDRRFGIAIFQFAICGTHAAQRSNAAFRADGAGLALGLANFSQATGPSGFKISLPPFVAVFVREDADGHGADGINGAAVLPAAAGVFLLALRNERGRNLGGCEFFVFVLANHVAKIQGDGVFGSESDGQRALRTIGPGIHERIEFEFDAEFFGHALHFINFVNVDCGGNGFEL